MTRHRGQKVGLLLLALLALVGIAWAIDWQTGSGFGPGFVRIVFGIITHLK